MGRERGGYLLLPPPLPKPKLIGGILSKSQTYCRRSGTIDWPISPTVHKKLTLTRDHLLSSFVLCLSCSPCCLTASFQHLAGFFFTSLCDMNALPHSLTLFFQLLHFSVTDCGAALGSGRIDLLGQLSSSSLHQPDLAIPMVLLMGVT